MNHNPENELILCCARREVDAELRSLTFSLLLRHMDCCRCCTSTSQVSPAILFPVIFCRA
jgi:hypothetical protein